MPEAIDIGDQFWQLNLAGERYRESGDYPSAEECHLAALKLAPQLAQDDARIAIVLDNLGTLYAQTGRLDLAIDKHREAIQKLKTSHPERVLDLALAMNNLGTAYQLIEGRDGEALNCFATARQLYETIPRRLSYISTILNLASVHAGLDSASAKARQYVEYALQLCTSFEQAHPDRPCPYRATAEFMAAEMMLNDGHLDQATPSIDQALITFTQRVGPTGEQTLNARAAQARLLRLRGDPRAEAALLTLIKDMATGHGTPRNRESGRLERARYELSLIYRAEARVIDEAEQLIDNMNSEEVRISQRLPYGSRREQIRDVCQTQERFRQFMSVLDRAGATHPGLAPIGVEHWLRRKGTAADILRAFGEHDRSAPLSPAQQELGRLRDALADDIRHSSPRVIQEDSAARERQARIAATRTAIENLERDAGGERLDGIGLLRSGLVGELLRALPVGTAMLEFCALAIRHQNNQEEAPAYGVFVVGGSQDARVRYGELGAYDAIGQLVGHTLAEITAHEAVRGVSLITDELPADDFTQATNDSLRAFAAAIEALLPAGTTRLIVSADADLCGMPFALLPHADGTRWLDTFEICQVSSGADLLTRQHLPQDDQGPALVVAAPQFSMVGRSEPYGDLSGARAEGHAVAERLGVQARIGPDARKEVVLDARRPEVLHLATHGFYARRLPFGITLTRAPMPVQDDSTAQPVVIADIGAPPTAIELDDALTMGGLAFAGANDAAYERDHDRQPADDGEVLAADLSKIDLTGTELVVLSACDTGRGTAVPAQGLWGLPLALQAAGAQAVVVSLWQVNDDSTMMLMTQFFDRLCRGDSKTAALQFAARTVRDNYPHPRFWAPFIAVGSDSPLRRFARMATA